jgi:hypothetical protein
MGLTVHRPDFFRQPLSRPELRGLLADTSRLFGFNQRQVESLLR